MRKTLMIALTCLLVVFAGNAMAGKYYKANKGDIFHCGCADNGMDLVWTHLNVSKRSAKGHSQHMAGDAEDCYTWVYDGELGYNVWTYMGTYERAFDDCDVPDYNDFPYLADCPTTYIEGSGYVMDYEEGDSCTADLD